MNDTFVHAVYGVRLSDDHAKRLEAALRVAREHLVRLDLKGALDNGRIEENDYAVRVGEAFDLEGEWCDYLDENGLVDSDAVDLALELVESEVDPELFKDLREATGACRAAKLYWTGDSDLHVGRCGVEPEEWVFGYGLMSFPRVVVPEAFRKKAAWLTWAEG